MARDQEKCLHDQDHNPEGLVRPPLALDGTNLRILSRKIPMKLTIINDDPARGPKVEIEDDGLDMFVIVNGVTIARRGRPGTTEADSWVSLEPEWTVTSSEDERRLEIRILYHGEPVVLH